MQQHNGEAYHPPIFKILTHSSRLDGRPLFYQSESLTLHSM